MADLQEFVQQILMRDRQAQQQSQQQESAHMFPETAPEPASELPAPVLDDTSSAAEELTHETLPEDSAGATGSEADTEELPSAAEPPTPEEDDSDVLVREAREPAMAQAEGPLPDGSVSAESDASENASLDTLAAGDDFALAGESVAPESPESADVTPDAELPNVEQSTPLEAPSELPDVELPDATDQGLGSSQNSVADHQENLPTSTPSETATRPDLPDAAEVPFAADDTAGMDSSAVSFSELPDVSLESDINLGDLALPDHEPVAVASRREDSGSIHSGLPESSFDPQQLNQSYDQQQDAHGGRQSHPLARDFREAADVYGHEVRQLGDEISTAIDDMHGNLSQSLSSIRDSMELSNVLRTLSQ